MNTTNRIGDEYGDIRLKFNSDGSYTAEFFEPGKLYKFDEDSWDDQTFMDKVTKAIWPYRFVQEKITKQLSGTLLGYPIRAKVEIHARIIL